MATTKKTTKKTTKVKKSTAVAKKPSTKTSAQMRVIIAKDVLAQIAKGRYRPVEGSWVGSSNLGDMDLYIEKRLDKDESLCRVDASEYVNKVKKCSVCALGAIFMSQVGNFGGITFTSGSYAYSVFEDLERSPLKRYFSISQLELIESCFEGLDGTYSGSMAKNSDRVSAQAYYVCYKNSTERMTAIMNNIIRNKGTFVPRQDLTKEMIIEATNLI